MFSVLLHRRSSIRRSTRSRRETSGQRSRSRAARLRSIRRIAAQAASSRARRRRCWIAAGFFRAARPCVRLRAFRRRRFRRQGFRHRRGRPRALLPSRRRTCDLDCGGDRGCRARDRGCRAVVAESVGRAGAGRFGETGGEPTAARTARHASARRQPLRPHNRRPRLRSALLLPIQTPRSQTCRAPLCFGGAARSRGAWRGFAGCGARLDCARSARRARAAFAGRGPIDGAACVRRAAARTECAGSKRSARRGASGGPVAGGIRRHSAQSEEVFRTGRNGKRGSGWNRIDDRT